MIKQISETEVLQNFFELMIDIEVGEKFDRSNSKHVEWLKRMIARRFGSGATFFALYSKASVALGIASVLINDSPILEGHSELLDIGVFQDHRRSGHGTTLLKHAELLSKEAGVYCMYISTYEGDTDNIKFYELQGYTLVATIPYRYGPNDKGQVYLSKKL